ncbi:MAG: radical SAM protein [Crenarchaeota archaeon]|nr:radical SAM protein [Thermoproteota archaeon]
MIRRAIILDLYTDEPAGLGVPPYINTWPRLAAGALWAADKDIDVKYYAIDTVRTDMDPFIKQAETSDILVVIAGIEVPGKYIGGNPGTLEEAERILSLIKNPLKILIGPAARHGLGSTGGKIASSRTILRKIFDVIVTGDPELYFYDLVKNGPEKTDPRRIRSDYRLADEAFVKGSKIITMHPNHGKNLVVEIETYRGCSRFITGGCSFCIEPRRGRPLQRDPRSIIEEVEALYRHGARHIRIGRQPDILVYGSKELGEKEFPTPDPEALRRLFYGIRSVAPGIRILHIDNVNPGTIAHHPEESSEALKVIIEYHSPGDVAALGIESFDEKVVKNNNLKVLPDEAIKAIEIINRIGNHRGWNGLPHLLPGINLLYGLPGETRETYRINYEYLKMIYDQGLLVRRINIRQVNVLENTPLWTMRDKVKNLLRRHKGLFRKYRLKIMSELDKKFLERVVPPGTLLDYLYVEKYVAGMSIARMPGSYPITVKIPCRVDMWKIVSVRTKGVAAKSVTGTLVGKRMCL